MTKKKFPNRVIAAISTLALLGAASLGLMACGNNAPAQDQSQTFSADDLQGPGLLEVNGTSYCVYVVDDDECQGSGLPEDRWLQAPEEEPDVPESDLAMQVWLYYMMYNMWFFSPTYGHYYIDHDRDHQWRARQESFKKYSGTPRAIQLQQRAVYRNGAGQEVRGDKVDPRNFAVRTNGGNRAENPCRPHAMGTLDTSYGDVEFASFDTFLAKPSGGGGKGGGSGSGGKGGGSGSSGKGSSGSSSGSGSSGSSSGSGSSGSAKPSAPAPSAPSAPKPSTPPAPAPSAPKPSTPPAPAPSAPKPATPSAPQSPATTQVPLRKTPSTAPVAETSVPKTTANSASPAPVGDRGRGNKSPVGC